MGSCIFSGVLRTRKEPEAKLWTTKADYARPTFRATMARDQFFQILRVIRFDDKTTINQWRSTDKLAPIRNLFEKFNQHISNDIHTKEHITIDEQFWRLGVNVLSACL